MSKSDLWKLSSETEWITSLNDGLSLSELIIRTRMLEEAPAKEIIICCDGRCPHSGKEISLAGSGILMSPETLKKFIGETGITTITSHSDCGAAKLAFSKLDPSDAAEYFDSEEYVKKWAMSIALENNLQYKHFTENQFNEKLHHERGIILDSTLKFHPSMFSGMPNMFIANSPRFASEDDYVKAVVKVLTGIAFGDHGFGKLFTVKEPFYILITARDEAEKKKLFDMCSEAVSDYGDLVVIRSCCL